MRFSHCSPVRFEKPWNDDVGKSNTAEDGAHLLRKAHSHQGLVSWAQPGLAIVPESGPCIADTGQSGRVQEVLEPVSD